MAEQIAVSKSGTDILESLGNTPRNTRGRQIRVGINCLRVASSYAGGVTTYVLGLLRGFATEGKSTRFRIYATPTNQGLFEEFREVDNFEIGVIDDSRLDLKRMVCRGVSLADNQNLYKFTSDSVFRKVQRKMEAESDILYTPTVVLECFDNRKPTVLSIHDIQHLHHPEFFSWARRISRKITYELSARHATYLQASSEYIKRDLLEHFAWLTEEQIEVIPSGVLIEKFAASSAPETLSRYALPERFLFFPAQLWPHKNHLTVLKALKLIEIQQRVRIPLILTGEKYSAATGIFAFVADQSMDYVRYLGKVPFADMVALYQRAAFVLTATLHESSSLPILEAAAAGTPVICSRIPPIEELGKVLHLNFFDPLDVDALARVIWELWRDEKIAAAQAAYNRERIGVYSWANTARKYVKLFERIASSSAAPSRTYHLRDDAEAEVSNV